jgi:hypothetical protein
MRNQDGLLKFGLIAAGGSLVCLMLAGHGDAVVIWCGVALFLMPMVVYKLRGNAATEDAENAEAPRNRHHNYVFASETAAPKRRRKVVA